MQAGDSTEWKTAADFPELGLGMSGPELAPPSLPVGQTGGQRQGLAITSLVLGLLSLVCFGFLAGVPAIICGHVARGRARRLPSQYGGGPFALAGLILGYVGTTLTLVILPAMLLPALSQAKGRAQEISCVNNLKQIGLAFRVWAIDHNGQFPFNVSTNNGGTLELCRPGGDGFDRNAAFHFRVMSNELSTTRILICPADAGKQPALNFESLQPGNLSYQVRSGTNVSDVNPSQVLAVCPIHNHVLLCDGSVQRVSKARREAMQKEEMNR